MIGSCSYELEHTQESTESPNCLLGSCYEVPIHSYAHIACMTCCVWFLYCGVPIATQIIITMCGHSTVWRNVEAYYKHNMLGPYTEYGVWTWAPCKVCYVEGLA